MTGEFYHDSAGVIRPVTPDVPTGLCCICGERYERRPDGTITMHTRAPRPGELIGTY